MNLSLVQAREQDTTSKNYNNKRKHCMWEDIQQQMLVWLYQYEKSTAGKRIKTESRTRLPGAGKRKKREVNIIII